MSADYINPFVEGTLQMMGSMFGLDCEVADAGARLVPEPTLFGTIRLQGSAQGHITVSLHERDGRQLVAAMLGMEEDEVDEEIIRDGLGEMANVIAGFARSVMATSDVEFNISLPEILDAPPTSAGGGLVHRKIESDLGSFHISLELQRAA